MRMLVTAFLLVAYLSFLPPSLKAQSATLLNVSYDPTREFYQEINRAFVKEWRESRKGSLAIRQSHGGSGKQARAVIDGLEADVVTLALAYDIDMIAEVGKLLPPDWQGRLPNNSSPYTSTIVFLVRKGNPLAIKDWDDLVRTDMKVITPNPKTSGGARWNYLAAWAFATRHFNGNEEEIFDFMKKLFHNVPVLDAGARGSMTTFLQRRIGDVFLVWEDEALLAINKLAKNNVEIVVPSISILAEPPVTWVDSVVEKRGTKEVAKAYLEFLYGDFAQELAGKHFFRPSSKKAFEKHKEQFAELKLITVAEFGGWHAAHDKHFSNGGVFDRIYSGN